MSRKGVRSTDLAVLEPGRRWAVIVGVYMCACVYLCVPVHVCVMRANDNEKLH